MTVVRGRPSENLIDPLGRGRATGCDTAFGRRFCMRE